MVMKSVRGTHTHIYTRGEREGGGHTHAHKHTHTQTHTQAHIRNLSWLLQGVFKKREHTVLLLTGAERGNRMEVSLLVYKTVITIF